MERLDLRLVEYFVAVAEELHFGRAAQRLHIAQPSLSQQIRRLEAQLGVRLFDRDSRNVRLTAPGRALLHEGRRTLAQAQRALQAARLADTPTLTVGFYGSAGSVLLPETLRRCSRALPSVEIHVRELLLGNVDDLRDGAVDIAFTRLVPGQTELAVEVLAFEPRLVALAPGHRLAAVDRLTFADLRGEAFIVNPASPGDRPPARWLAEQRRHGLPGRVGAAASSIQEILALVAAGRGISLVPASVARLHARAEVRYVPMLDADPAVVSLAWRPDAGSPAIEALRAVARRAAAASPHLEPVLAPADVTAV